MVYEQHSRFILFLIETVFILYWLYWFTLFLSSYNVVFLL